MLDLKCASSGMTLTGKIWWTCRFSLRPQLAQVGFSFRWANIALRTLDWPRQFLRVYSGFLVTKAAYSNAILAPSPLSFQVHPNKRPRRPRSCRVQLLFNQKLPQHSVGHAPCHGVFLVVLVVDCRGVGHLIPVGNEESGDNSCHCPFVPLGALLYLVDLTCFVIHVPQLVVHAVDVFIQVPIERAGFVE